MSATDDSGTNGDRNSQRGQDDRPLNNRRHENGRSLRHSVADLFVIANVVDAELNQAEKADCDRENGNDVQSRALTSRESNRGGGEQIGADDERQNKRLAGRQASRRSTAEVGDDQGARQTKDDDRSIKRSSRHDG